MSIPIILICGKAGSGKSTAADILCNNYMATTIAFADPFKEYATRYLDVDNEILWGLSERRNEIIELPDFHEYDYTFHDLYSIQSQQIFYCLNKLDKKIS